MIENFGDRVVFDVLHFDLMHDFSFDIREVLEVKDGRALVAFEGYPDNFNDWVEISAGLEFYGGFKEKLDAFEMRHGKGAPGRRKKQRDKKKNDQHTGDDGNIPKEKEEADSSDFINVGNSDDGDGQELHVGSTIKQKTADIFMKTDPKTPKKIKMETKSQVKKDVRESKVGSSTWLVKLLYEKLEDPGCYSCSLCHEIKKASSDVNLSNLQMHLSRKHKSEYEGLVMANHDGKAEDFAKTLVRNAEGIRVAQKSVQPSLDKWVANGLISKVARTKISFLLWIIDSEIAFHPVESDHFTQFVKEAQLNLDSAFLMKQTTATIRTVIDQLAEERLGKCVSVNVTSDMWTSVATRKFLVGTYHGIDSETLELVHHVLDLIPMFGSAIGPLIQAVLEQRIEKHTGGRSIGAYVSDSGANMLKAGKGFDAFGTHDCFGHRLKGVIEACLGAEAKATEPEFHCSAAAFDLETIKNVANVLRVTGWLEDHVLVDEQLCLIVENVTRWEGKYRALDRFITLESALKKSKDLKRYFEAKDQKKEVVDDVFSVAFFSRLKSYRTILKLFHKISKKSQADNAPTIPWVAHWIYKLFDRCNDGSVLGNCLKKAVEQRLMKHYLTGTTLVLKAALMNPFCYSVIKEKLDDAHFKQVWSSVCEDALRLVKDQSEKKALKKVFVSTRELLESKMQTWIDSHDKTTILDFWKSQQDQLTKPFIAIASVYLGIPATTGASERSFSSATGVVTKKRNRIGDKLLEDLVIIRDWIKNGCYKFDDLIRAIIKLVERENTSALVEEEEMA